MAAAGENSRSLVELVNEICDRFESELVSGQNPRIEEFLDVPVSVENALLRQLLLLEWSYLASKGDPIRADEYRDRFPNVQEIVESALELHHDQPHETIDWSQDGTDRSDSGPTASHSFLVGSHFGQYEMIDLLGRGAFGSVYLARDPSLDRLVAIKVSFR